MPCVCWKGGSATPAATPTPAPWTIGPLIKRTVTPGAVVYTDEYDIYARLVSV
jgi:hypothetical protein